MINAIANISLNHIERASTDEFERDILSLRHHPHPNHLPRAHRRRHPRLVPPRPPQPPRPPRHRPLHRRHLPQHRLDAQAHRHPHRPLQLDFGRPLPHPDVPLLRRHRLPRLRAFRCRRPLPHRRHRRCHHVRPHLARTPTEAEPPRPVPPRRRARGLMLTPPPTRTPPPALRAHRGQRVVSVCYAP